MTQTTEPNPLTKPKRSCVFYLLISVAVLLGIILMPSLFPCFIAANLGSQFVIIKGKTKKDVAQEYKSEFDAMVTKFGAIARLLPPVGEANNYRSVISLEPKPIFDGKEGIYNTEIIKYEQLLKPRQRSYQIEPYTPYIDTDEPLIDAMAEANLDDKFGYMNWWGKREPACGLEEEYKGVLGYKYLIILRTVKYMSPTATDKEVIFPGSYSAECFLASLETPKILTSFNISIDLNDPKEKTSQINNINIGEETGFKKVSISPQLAFLQYRPWTNSNKPKPKPYTPPPTSPKQQLIGKQQYELNQRLKQNLSQSLKEITGSTFRFKYDD